MLVKYSRVLVLAMTARCSPMDHADLGDVGLFGGSNPRSLTATSLIPLSLLGLVLLYVGPSVVTGQHIVPSLRRDPGLTLKEYSGIRARSDSHRQTYYCDQTIAIVELGPGKELFNCELIEV